MSSTHTQQSGFGHLIFAILTENNGKILSKYKKTRTKHMAKLEQKHMEQKAALKRAKDRREMMDEVWIKPNLTTAAKHEQVMRRAATYGCVALFKAVAKHQRDLKRSLEAVDVDMDVLQKRTMRIEQRSTQKLVDSLHDPATHRLHDAMVETPNPLKRRRLTVPKHLQSVLMDQESGDEDEDEDVEPASSNSAKPWRVLDADLVLNADKTGNDRVDAMEGDSELDEAFENDSD